MKELLFAAGSGMAGFQARKEEGKHEENLF